MIGRIAGQGGGSFIEKIQQGLFDPGSVPGGTYVDQTIDEVDMSRTLVRTEVISGTTNDDLIYNNWTHTLTSSTNIRYQRNYNSTTVFPPKIAYQVITFAGGNVQRGTTSAGSGTSYGGTFCFYIDVPISAVDPEKCFVEVSGRTSSVNGGYDKTMPGYLTSSTNLRIMHNYLTEGIFHWPVYESE